MASFGLFLCQLDAFAIATSPFGPRQPGNPRAATCNAKNNKDEFLLQFTSSSSSSGELLLALQSRLLEYSTRGPVGDWSMSRSGAAFASFLEWRPRTMWWCAIMAQGYVCLCISFPYHSALLKKNSTDWERQLHSARDGAESISWQGFVYQIQTAVRLGYVGLCELKMSERAELGLIKSSRWKIHLKMNWDQLLGMECIDCNGCNACNAFW